MEITAKKEDEGKLVATLQSSDAEEFDKDVACRQLAVIGTAKSVPALAALLENEHLYDLARHALGEIPDPAAGAALRAALPKMKGRQLIAVINSIGNRRDREAVGALLEQLTNNDLEVVAEAASSLAKIGGREAGMGVSEALANASDKARPLLADACLKSAHSLMDRDRHDVAARTFDRVREAKVPSHIRKAATQGAILARRGEGVGLLVEQIKSDDYGMFEIALRVVRELPGAGVARAVVAEVSKLAPEKAALLLRALGDRRDAAALPGVLEAAEKGDTKVRVAALQAAGQIGGKSAEAALKKAAGDSNAQIAETAKKSLAAFETLVKK